MKLILVAILLAMATVVASKPLTDGDVEKEWKGFLGKFNKNYRNSADQSRRRTIFKENLQRIKQHNDANVGYELGINQFSDMTNDEYRQTMLMQPDFQRNDLTSIPTDDLGHRVKRQTLPDFVNYTASGCVGPVKNQGACGSCWAFATVAILEYYNCVNRSNVLTTLSEQQIIDCTYNVSTYNYNLGCSGGHTDSALTYVKNTGGIDTDASYPYTASHGACNYNAANSAGRCNGYVHTTKNSESVLKQVLATVGPVSALIDAHLYTFQHYTSGIYNDTACTQTVTHAVTIVGYGTDNGVDYWLVKNSWGTAWGMNGYIKMIRNYNNQCAISAWAYYPKM